MIKFKEIQVGSLIGKWKTEDGRYIITKENEKKYLIYENILGVQKEIMTSNNLEMAKEYVDKQYDLAQNEKSIFFIEIYGGEYSESYSYVNSIYLDLKQALNYYYKIIECIKTLTKEKNYKLVQDTFNISGINLVEMRTNRITAPYNNLIVSSISYNYDIKALDVEIDIKELNIKI